MDDYKDKVMGHPIIGHTLVICIDLIFDRIYLKDKDRDKASSITRIFFQ